MKVELELPFSQEELTQAQEEASKGNAGPLRSLCQKEVDRFESAVRRHSDYSDGLIRIERFVVEGYLYQKLRGHVDASTETDHIPQEG